MAKIQNGAVLLSTLALASCAGQAARPELQTIPQTKMESPSSYQSRQDQAKPQVVLDWLKEGNERFATGLSQHGGFPIDARVRIQSSAVRQKPLAVVLSCIDSRTSPELIFDTAVGDIFTARVGANVVNDDILGSLEIAVEAGARVVVVLGHTDCGGVRAACNGLELGHMTQLLTRVKPAIQAANLRLDANSALSQAIGLRSATNRKYIAEVSHANAAQSLKQILNDSPILREKIRRKEIILVSALYDVDTGKVNFDSNDLGEKK